MPNETLPASVFPLLVFESVPDRQQDKTQEHQRLPFAEAVAEITEQNQPRVRSRNDRWIEGMDEPRERHIPLKQAHEHEEEGGAGKN